MVTSTENVRRISAIGFGFAFIWIGIQHFTNVGFFVPIVPDILGAPEFWVYASGVVEILLGASMIHPRTRQKGGMGTAAFLVLVYWANLNMWINDIPIDGNSFSTSAHIARATAQLGMIGLALWIAEWKSKKE
ncbi:hypothetical protein N9Z48_02795 [Euryarchaeota archaeon]|nr:hypothetical protein [Euryarchaeota archaeon]MDA8727858.1 hypothetical protein [Euryarchaeota archaeon]MDB2560646.1 hypothetical protein [Euryarchaeota archaeon]